LLFTLVSVFPATNRLLFLFTVHKGVLIPGMFGSVLVWLGLLILRFLILVFLRTYGRGGTPSS